MITNQKKSQITHICTEKLIEMLELKYKLHVSAFKPSVMPLQRLLLRDKLKLFPVVIDIIPQILSKELNIHLNTSCLDRKWLNVLTEMCSMVHS